MWLVSCRRQRMLNQGPSPDSKCKLNISSFLTLPYPLDCLICAKDIMIILFLLHMMGSMRRLEGGSFMLEFGWGDRGWGSFVLFFCCCCSSVAGT